MIIFKNILDLGPMLVLGFPQAYVMTDISRSITKIILYKREKNLEK